MKQTEKYEKRLLEITKAVNLSEAASNFNLSRGARLHDDDFDDDDISTDLIAETQLKYKVLSFVNKLKNGQLTKDEGQALLEQIRHLPHKYTAEDKEELTFLISLCVEDNNYDFNFIDTSRVTDMSKLFSSTKFNSDISQWDVSNVRDMSFMFQESQFNGDISNWDVSNVKNMWGMFAYSKFNGDISRWDVSNVRNMHRMFSVTEFNRDISNWNVSKVEEIGYMFAYSEFNQNLSNWQINSKCADRDSMFVYCPIEERNKPVCMLSLSEAVSNFNLSRGARVHNDDFDNDEASVELILNTEKKYKLLALITKLLDGTINDAELDYFRFTYFIEDNKIQYKVYDVKDLDILINACISFFGTECDLNWIDVSEITDFTYEDEDGNLKGLFEHSNFDGDISRWDVSNALNLSYMFESSDFTGDISNWDVSNAKYMHGMFYSSSFNGDISNWDVSKVEDMQCMFSLSLFNRDISDWDVSSCTDASFMFSSTHFNQDISSWDLSKADCDSIFMSCPIEKEFKPKALQNISESAFNLLKGQTLHKDKFDDDEVTIEDIDASRQDFFNKCIAGLLTDTITESEIRRFLKYSRLITAPIFKVQYRNGLIKLIKQCVSHLGRECDLNWIDVSGITDMNHLFFYSKFNGDISRWDTHNVTDMNGIFCWSAFNGDISNWDVSSVTNMRDAFASSVFDGDISKWDVSSVTNMHEMFENACFSGDISDWDVSSVGDMEKMFSGTEKFNCNLNKWDVSSVINMSEMFEHSNFNGDISDWNVSGVKNMKYMFAYSKFNGDISDWDVSGVTDMSNMFMQSQFNQDIGSWDVSSVENMYRMFNGSVFNQNIGDWDVSNVKNMSQMFENSKFNKNISKWDISNVEAMSEMFYSSDFRQDLRRWEMILSKKGYSFRNLWYAVGDE